MRVKEPAERVSVNVGDLLTIPLRFVKPSEMIKIEVPAEDLERVDGELSIDCEMRR